MGEGEEQPDEEEQSENMVESPGIRFSYLSTAITLIVTLAYLVFIAMSGLEMIEFSLDSFEGTVVLTALTASYLAVIAYAVGEDVLKIYREISGTDDEPQSDRE